MTLIISVAHVAVLLASLFVIVTWRNVPCHGPQPVNTFTLVALLFTAGLDMGLVMLPLTEFPVYAGDTAYNFTNPLAVEFGMWGPLVWMMYFLATFYFIVLEPRLKVFEIPAVKWVYNLTIIATCAFTGYLFLINLPVWAVWALVIVAIGISVGIFFVINSLDSLIRLYSRNLGVGISDLGWQKYFPLHFGLQFALVLAYQFTPFKIEWVGLVVIGSHMVVFYTIATRNGEVRAAVADARNT